MSIRYIIAGAGLLGCCGAVLIFQATSSVPVHETSEEDTAALSYWEDEDDLSWDEEPFADEDDSSMYWQSEQEPARLDEPSTLPYPMVLESIPHSPTAKITFVETPRPESMDGAVQLATFDSINPIGPQDEAIQSAAFESPQDNPPSPFQPPMARRRIQSPGNSPVRLSGWIEEESGND